MDLGPLHMQNTNFDSLALRLYIAFGIRMKEKETDKKKQLINVTLKQPIRGIRYELGNHRNVQKTSGIDPYKFMDVSGSEFNLPLKKRKLTMTSVKDTIEYSPIHVKTKDLVSDTCSVLYIPASVEQSATPPEPMVNFKPPGSPGSIPDVHIHNPIYKSKNDIFIKIKQSYQKPTKLIPMSPMKKPRKPSGTVSKNIMKFLQN